MDKTRQVIHVQWEPPCTLAEAREMRDPVKDRGVYQIYGSHPVYGSDVLLYIGRTGSKRLGRTFSLRLQQHDVNNLRHAEWAQNNLQFYLGRLTGTADPKSDIWGTQIEIVESLLIAAHKPAYNAASLGKTGGSMEDGLRSVHIMNWGEFGRLLPEVSAERWTWLGANSFGGLTAYGTPVDQDGSIST